MKTSTIRRFRAKKVLAAVVSYSYREVVHRLCVQYFMAVLEYHF